MTLDSLTLPSQLFQLVSAGLVFVVLLLIFNFILLPIFRLQHYKEQGILTRFIPLLGFFALLKEGEKDHDDNLYHVKKNAQKNPNLEIEAYNVGNRAFILLYSPRLLKSFLTNADDEKYQKYKRLQPITLFSKLGFAALNGRIFREHRKIVAKLFSYDHLSRKLPAMHANALKAIDGILKTQNLKNVALQNYTLQFSADNFADVFFGGHTKNYFVDGKPVLNFTNDLQSESGILTRTPLLFLFGPGIVKFGFLKSHREFNGRVKRLKIEVNRLIQDRKSKSEQREVDLLDILLETQKSNDPDIAYTDEMIVEEYISLFVSSTENPTHLIVLCLYLLDKHPEFKKKILEEIHEIYEKESLSSQTLHKMNHLHALIQETLRLQSPSFSSQPRIAIKDFQLENYNIKEGTVIMPILFHQHYNENVFEDALKFKPERWLDQSLHLDAFGFIPFSAGPRNCIGQHFSALEIKLMLCEFLKKFEYNVSTDFKLIKTQRFLNVPKDPILLNLTLREKK